MFKKETGKSFVSYVTDYRMEQAARLLIETNEKSYVIAQKVGYTDPNYFSYVFKRKFGVSPSKYRAEHIKSENKYLKSKCGYDMQGENQNTEKSRITERVRSWEKYGGWTNLNQRDTNDSDGSVFACFHHYHVDFRVCYVYMVFYVIKGRDCAEYPKADGTDGGESGRLSCQYETGV